MRKVKAKHVEGDVEIVTKFLWLPKELQVSSRDRRVTRWLETASWKRVWVGEMWSRYAGWFDMCWTDI